MEDEQILSVEHYAPEFYDHRGKWYLYWEQIEAAMALPNVKYVLVVGVGTGVVDSYLRRLGKEVSTIDVDKRLHPSVVGDVRTMNKVNTGEFDLVLCCHVFEHLPWDDMPKAFCGLRNVLPKGKKVIFSVPHFKLFIESLVHLHGQHRTINLSIPLPFLSHRYDGVHYWELGKKGYSAQSLRKTMQQAGFTILKEWYPPVNAWSHYFLLEAV